MKLFRDDGRDCRNRRWLIYFFFFGVVVPDPWEASSRSEEVGLAARDEHTCFRGNSQEGASDWRCKADWRIWIPGCISSMPGSLYTYCIAQGFAFGLYWRETCFCNCNIKMYNVNILFSILVWLSSFSVFILFHLLLNYFATQERNALSYAIALCVNASHFEIRVFLTFLSTAIHIYIGIFFSIYSVFAFHFSH